MEELHFVDVFGESRDGRRKHDYGSFEYTYKAEITNVYALTDKDRQLMTRISVTVRKDGMMTINKVAGPSGDRVFDLSALKAIRKTGRVEPPPFEKNEEIILNFYPDQ